MRILYVLGGSLLQVAAFLSWQNCELLGVTVPLPGLLWHGAWLLGIGTLLMGMGLTRLKGRLLVPVLCAIALYCCYVDVHEIYTRGDYALAQLQLKISPLNQVLANLSVAEIEVYHRGSDPWARIGRGPWAAAAGVALILFGYFGELFSEVKSGRKKKWALLGIPSCRRCGMRAPAWMHFCSGCGLNFTGKRVCAACRLAVNREARFCPHCGVNCAERPPTDGGAGRPPLD